MSESQVNEIYNVNKKHIKGFFKEHRFLSNFHEASFIDREGRIWPTTEHFYQGMKSEIEEEQEVARALPLNKIKRFGRTVSLRKDWEAGVKDDIMLEALVYKFTQNEDIKQKLLDTGDKYLEESNWWNDRYWGRFLGIGQNKLGRLLMELRETIRLREKNK